MRTKGYERTIDVHIAIYVPKSNRMPSRPMLYRDRLRGWLSFRARPVADGFCHALTCGKAHTRHTHRWSSQRILVGVITIFNFQRAFDVFLFGRSRPATEIALENFYKANGSWDGLGEALRRLPAGPDRDGSLPFISIADANGMLVYSGGRQERIGMPVSQPILRRSPKIEVDGETVGYLVFDPFQDRHRPETPERVFVSDAQPIYLSVHCYRQASWRWCLASCWRAHSPNPSVR